MTKVKISVLNDDRHEGEMCGEHGLSYFIEVDDKKILFDCGQTEIFKQNAQKLNINLADTDFVVLSHGHYDHGNGLKYFNKKVPFICHPKCFSYRIRKSNGGFGGISSSRDEIKEKFNLIEAQTSYKITENTYFLGEIERKNNFEAKKFPTKNIDGSDDLVPDDSGLAITTASGLIVITGCGHSGICNIIEHAKSVTKESRVCAVIGGFHLKEIDEGALKTIEYFKKENIKNIYLGHCTDDSVCSEFEKSLENVTVVHSGTIIEITK